MELKDRQIEVLNTVYDYVPRLVNGIQDAINYMHTGKEAEFFALMPNIIEGTEWVIKAIKLTQDIHGQAVGIEEFNQVLAGVVEALENQDSLLVADILEYEIIPRIISWNEAISKVVFS